MSESVVIAGPASPRALAHWLDGADQERARELPGLGGSVVNNLAEALLASGTDVELVTLAPEIGEQVALEGPRLNVLVGPYRDRARTRAKDLFRDERKEVESLLRRTSGGLVHVQWTYEFALGALKAQARPTIVTAQDAPLTILRYDRSRYRAARTLMAYAARARGPVLSANSPYLAMAWRRQMMYRRDIPIIPNVVGPGQRSRSRDTAPIILDVTDAGHRKNAAALVRAFPAIRASHPDAKLRLVGHGLDGQSPLVELADRLGVLDAISLVGALDSSLVHDEYSRAAIFAHASLEESFGMTVAEAMSHKLPIVAGVKAGAVPWVLGGGEAGLLVDTSNPTHLATGINELLGNENARARLSTAAARRAAEVFSPGAVAATALQIYEDLRKGRL